MGIEENKAAVRRLYEQGHNSGDWSAAEALLAPNFVDHAIPPPMQQLRGPEAFKAIISLVRAGFPDLRNTIDDIVAEGDRVAFRVTSRGTHNGSFFGISPTGRTVVQEQMHIVRFAGGRVVEHWAVRDDLGMFQQLGAAPSPASNPPAETHGQEANSG